MKEYGEIMAGAGLVAYIFIGLFIILFAWWGYRLIKGKGQEKKSTDLPGDGELDYTKGREEIGGILKESKQIALGKGDIKCLCFRKIKGVNIADFTSILEPIGEMYQFDPSCPISGSGYIVKEDEKGEIVDYDPREVKFVLDQSPEYAWFAIRWDIVKQVFFVPVQWWKSTSVWFAGAMLVIVFIASLAVLG